MLFNSLQFLVYFVFVTAFYFSLPHRFRWLLLLLASCFFYMSFIPMYILILGFTIVIDYFAGILIEKSSGKKRKFYLVMSLIANIGVLAVFKYYNFIAEQVQLFAGEPSGHKILPALGILLPIGLSFHTFQAMSYTIEVYRGNQQAEKKFGIYALYVMFYPQLVAGPIERPQNLLHQFYDQHSFDLHRFKQGISLMIFGFTKKVVIADRLSMAVDFVYGDPLHQNGWSLLIATFFYAFQIYCDFSGYADIAIGSASVMGFRLMENFRNPYFAVSIPDFWRRWHISLSTWFKDYLYVSLGGNRTTRMKHFRNLLIVFTISGLWHGANYTFLAWGLLHGVLLCFYFLRKDLLNKLHIRIPDNFISKALRISFTFTTVCLSWVLFRAKNISDAAIIYSKIFSLKMGEILQTGMDRPELYFCFLLIFLLLLRERYRHLVIIRTNSTYLMVHLLLILCCYFFGVFNQKQFIYFQF